MRLRTLQLHNYRRFRALDLEFPDGVIAITGPNGAGKSTLIEAIAWCLFGHEAARTAKDLLKHAGAAPGEDTWVRLEFELDGQAIAVTRRLRGKTLQGEAQVEVDGVLVVAPGANSGELTTRHLERVLGMDRDGFRSTVVAHQGDLSALSEATPGDRKRLILGLLGVDDVDAAIAGARTEKREASIRLEEVRRLLVREPELRARRDALRQERSRVDTEWSAASVQVEKLTLTLQGLSAQAAELTSQRQAHVELRNRLDGLQKALQARDEQRLRIGVELQMLERRHDELVRLQRDGTRFEGLDERVARLEAARDEQRAHDRLAAERSHVEADLQRWTQERAAMGPDGHDPDALAREIFELRRDAETAAEGVAEAETHARHLEEERRRLLSETEDQADEWRDIRSLGPEAPCPICRRTLGPLADEIARRAAEQQGSVRRRMDGMQFEVQDLRLKAAALRQSQSDVRSRLIERERLFSQVQLDHERRRVLDTEARRLRSRLALLAEDRAKRPPMQFSPEEAALIERQRTERERWREAVARLESETARAPRLRADLETLAAQVEETRRDIEASTRELGRLRYRDGSWEETRRREDEERKGLHEAERRRDVLAERREGLDRQAAQLEAELSHLDGLRAGARGLEGLVRLGELLAADRGDKGLLPEFRSHLISRARPALARAASDIVAEATQGRYSELQIDDDYGIRVFDRGQAWPLDRFSGGEKDVVHLALRLAVSELLARVRRARRLRFVALDEVLAGQDEDRRQSVLGALRGLGAHFRQVLLVTHLDEVRERVDHVLRIVPGPDGTSRASASWSEAG